MIDQEIRNALKVEPSPEFVARVRTRIAAEPAPSGWRWSWTLAGSAAMAAALVLAVVVTRPPASPVAQPFRAANGDDAGLKPRATNDQLPAPPTAAPSEVAQAFRPAVGTRNAGDAAVRLKPDTTELAILFDDAEAHALQGLIAAARSGHITLTSLMVAAPPAPMDLEPIADIVIAPITIDPIAPLSGAEGERP